jgi:LuxR family transcriptional regulator, maltose regulon positive regulatory protein
VGVPPPSEALLSRPRLLRRLSRAVQTGPVTLLAARIGSGKTVLAHCWVEAAPPGVYLAWLTLGDGDGDGDPVTYWAHVEAALTGAGLAPADGAMRSDGASGPDGDVGLRLAARLRRHPQPVVLVLDDAELLTDRRTTDALDLLVREADGRLRLVLCADADPLLPLRAYRQAGTLSEIRGEQLAFTAEETRQLLTGLGVPVTAGQAIVLQRVVEGWPVALRLAAACLQTGTEPGGARRRAGRR